MRAFCDAVTALSCANAHVPGWWYTWLSARDRFNSGVLDAFLANAEGRPPPARRRGGWLRFAKEIAAALENRFTARFNPAPPHGDRTITVLVIAPATAAALDSAGTPYRDSYFGPLMDHLRARGERPVLIGLPVAERRRTIRALARRDDIPAASVAHYYRLVDIVAAAWHAARTRFDTAGVRLPDGGDAGPLLRAELACERGPIMHGFLVERALRRAFDRYGLARAIHTYENNPWERAVDRAAHDSASRRPVVGYLHCAVLPSHLKNVIAPEEAPIRPAPDRIVCTGPAARDVFLRLGAHDPKRVHDGCALRGAPLASLVPRTAPPRSVRTVLVLLEGLPSMAALLRFLAEAAPRAGERRILLRPHPVMPLSALLPAAGISLGPASGLEESRAPDLASALAGADAAVYQSSTAAMTALAMGIPLVKVRLPGPLEDDPLFACDALKAVIDRPERLAPALAGFESMTDARFVAERDRARAYLMRYLAPADDAALDAFAGPRGWPRRR